VRRSAEEIATTLGGSAFPLDESRDQYRVVLVGTVRSIDVSPLKTSILDDLRQRDFTVNAMATSLEANGSLAPLIDPCGGEADLESKLLRAVSEAALEADPLRLLRGVRIAVELDMEVEHATASAFRDRANLLAGTAAERQRDELTRILATSRAAAGIRLMDDLGVLSVVLPELMPAHGVEQPRQHHYWDVFDHSVEALAALDSMLSSDEMAGDGKPALAGEFRASLAWYPLGPYLDEDAGGHSRRVLLKLAGLLHDVAKPETKSTDRNGRVRFLGHPDLGARKAASICGRLRFSSRETQFVSILVEEHLRPTQLAAPGQAPSARSLYRFFRDLGDAAPACLILVLADGAAAAGPRLTRERWRSHVAYVSYLLEHEQAHADAVKAPRLINGNDLIDELGLKPGPDLGRLLSDVDEAIGAGEVATREDALSYARGVVGGRGNE